MRYGKIEGDPIDLDRYPDDTRDVISAIHSGERRHINGTTITGLSLKEISDDTHLTKSQVRTRVKKLLANEHLEEIIPHPDRSKPTKYYSLEKRAKLTAWALELGDEVLGGIPKEPSQQDIVDLLGRIAKNEEKIHRIKKRLGNARQKLNEW